jgi:PAS domain S-box-containing protein
LDDSTQFRSPLSRYGLAVLLVAFAAAVRYALRPVIGSLTPLLFFSLVQVAVTLLAGRGPGIFSMLLGTVVGYYLFLLPGGQLSGQAKVYYVILNMGVAMGLIWMADTMRRSRNEARRSEAEARAAHARLADLLTRIGDAYFSFDLEWRCLSFNQRASIMARKAPEAMTGKTFRALMPGVFTGSRAHLLQQALQKQEQLQLDGLAEPDGIWFELSAYPGPASVSVFIRDVTDKKRAAIAIARSEEHFRRIFDESPVGMTIIGRDARILRVNNATCKMLEYSEEELLSRTITDVTPPEDLETSGFYSRKQQALITGRIEHLQMEKRFVTKSGKVLWTNLNASILREGPDNWYFLGTIENITERKQVEEQLRESQKLESLGVLAGGIAHDFNNLLTGILGNASLSLDLAPSNSPMRPLLKRLVQASERAADLTRQLLAYAGKGRFILSAISLSAMVEEITGLVRASIPAHVRIDLELAPDIKAIEADPAQIHQIIMNLILNAAESIPGNRSGLVTVRTFTLTATEEDLRGTLPSSRPQPGRYAALEVTDNGSGMASETQTRMFEPFFTTKFTGRGLGLSAVLGIVASYHGVVRVESQVGIGTRFLVLLPAGEKAVEVSPVSRPEDLEGSGTILIVDDEPLVMALARNALERAGYRVLSASGGLEALDVLEQNAEDVGLVVLDVTMPGMSCEEILKRLKAMRPNLPVILSTGHSEAEISGRFAGAGLAGFLQKPYTASQLAEKTKSAMQPL